MTKAKTKAKKAGAPLGNQNALGNKGNADNAFYPTPLDLQAKIDEYFEWVKGESETVTKTRTNKDGSTEEVEMQVWSRLPEPLTITGLALFLGFADRQSLNDYEEKIEFSFMIKKARTRVEHGYEKALHMQSPTGAIFALKNMGWQDKTENINKNTNLNYNSVEMTPEEVKQIAKAFEEEF